MWPQKTILVLTMLSAFAINTHASVLDLGGGENTQEAILAPESPEATPAETAAELGVAEDYQDLTQTVSSSRVQITINKRSQRMSVTVDGYNEFYWKVSTARKGYRTPTGGFRPNSLQVMHYSKKYDNSPMPHSIFFLGGYAIHGTNEAKNLGRPASHGCVRLSKANARTLFYLVKQYGMSNTVISIY